MAQSIRKADKPPIVFNPVPSECFAIGEKVHGSRYFEALVTVEQARRSPFLTFSSSSLKEPRKSCLMDLPSQGKEKGSAPAFRASKEVADIGGYRNDVMPFPADAVGNSAVEMHTSGFFRDFG